MKPMKKQATLLITLLISFSWTMVYGQAAEESPQWFSSSVVADGVHRIDDNGSDNIYLVEGTDKALLIDTGTGMADLKGYAESLTDLPITVVNTHGHPDHAGGNFQFETVYLHPRDFTLASQFTNPESHANSVKNTLDQNPELESVLIADISNYPEPELVPIEEGYVFDLGGRELEVIEVPGHTPGSLVLLDGQNQMIFSGDNNNTLVWLFLDHCLPLETYLHSLRDLNDRVNEFDTMYPGHGGPIDSDFISTQIQCVQNILSGNCEGEPYESFAGNGRICTFKEASVAFDPDNLFEE